MLFYVPPQPQLNRDCMLLKVGIILLLVLPPPILLWLSVIIKLATQVSPKPCSVLYLFSHQDAHLDFFLLYHIFVSHVVLHNMTLIKCKRPLKTNTLKTKELV